MRIGFRGVTVTVLSPSSASSDPFGAPIEEEPVPTQVENVIVDSPDTKDIEQTTRQHGVSCDLVLHYPKTNHESLRGCKVILPAPWGATFEVIGDPMPYDPRLTPGAHDRRVPVRRVVG